MWPNLPSDVLDHFRSAFGEANKLVTELMVNLPSVRETSLDDALIQALIPRSAPKLLRSGAVVRMDIHNIGGLRRIEKWEIADIGILVFVYKGGKIIAQKVGLLQSKRLFPLNDDVSDDDGIGFLYGMNALFQPEPMLAAEVLNRQFVFNDSCKYQSLKSRTHQVETIEKFSERLGTEIFYLLYNPPKPNMSITYPLKRYVRIKNPLELGARVASSKTLHGLMSKMPDGRAISLQDVSRKHSPAYGYRLEEWASDLLLRCKVGREFTKNDDELVSSLMMRRSGPIGAAIRYSVHLPE